MALKLPVQDFASFKCTDALEKQGLVVTLTGEGTVALCSDTEKPFGIALKSTEDPFKPDTYLANQYVPIAFHGIVEVNLTENQAVSVGDRLVPALFDTKEGYVAKFSPTAWPSTYAAATAETIEGEKSQVIGIALEAVTTGTGVTKKIKVLLQLRLVR